MSHISIALLDIERDSDVKKVRAPSFDDIEGGIRSHDNEAGRITLYESGDQGWTVVVTGTPNFYGIDVIESEESAWILMNSNGTSSELIPVYGYEFQGDQGVSDINLVVKLIMDLIETREYVVDDPNVYWKHRDT